MDLNKVGFKTLRSLGKVMQKQNLVLLELDLEIKRNFVPHMSSSDSSVSPLTLFVTFLGTNKVTYD